MPRDDPSSSVAPEVEVALQRLPAVHRLVAAVTEVDGAPPSMVARAVRAVLDEQRGRILAGDGHTELPDEQALINLVVGQVRRWQRRPLAGVINGTGIIIHTGLGRAPLADVAVAAAAEAARHYAPVELDLESGERGRRSAIVRHLLCELTGAESATVVNNNAAAVVLSLATIARGQSVIVSRGELVEIGGSFRLPDVMRAAGATLREVGTTNRTRRRDYETAIDDTTAALMKVHTSNYRIEGFTESVDTAELVEIAREHGLTVIDDIGSGLLRPEPSAAALADEPSATAAVAAGADLVLFSGDKLLGGPQSGIIVGRRHLIDALERHPLMRAVRVDKIILAALEATLQLHRDVESLGQLPVRTLMDQPCEVLEQRARRLAEALRGTPGLADVQVRPSSAFMGGGSVPTQAIESVALVLQPADLPEHELARRLRTGTPAVIPRVQDGAVWIDLRTVMPAQDDGVVVAVREAL
jgi:L-seryl-tRNA(Ser) seleniumtransferase